MTAEAAIEREAPIVIGSYAADAIDSWRRMLGNTPTADTFERASVELLRVASKERHPDARQEIIDSLFDMGRAANIGDDDALQAIMAAAKAAPPDTRPNGAAAVPHIVRPTAIEMPRDDVPPANDAAEYGIHGMAAGAEPAGPRFIPVAIDDVQIPVGPAYLVDGILPIRGLAVFVGEPKAGKSNLAADMGFAVARGTAYGGRPTLPGPVFYLTSEGVLGFRRRLVAMRRHHGAEGEGVPFFMLENMPNIGSEKTDVGDMLRDLDQFILDRDLPPPRMVVLDTLARCIGEGDENSARDMGRAVSRCEAIERHFGCLVGLVHHVGKDPGRGARGSNAINGAADVLIVIEKHDGHSSARVDQMKDGPEGIEWTFRLLPFDLGETSETPTETTENVSACVVELLSEPTQAKQRETKSRKTPRGAPGDLLNVIRRGIEEAGQRDAPSDLVPRSVRAIDRATLKRYCKIMAWQDQDEKPDAFRSTLSRSMSTLREADAIGFSDEWVWLT